MTKASRGDFRGAFIAGTVDSALAALEMDSLAKMELCIAIEVGSGVSLAPEELERFGSLGDLAAEIARRTGA
ncbi:MAG: acyl carrier protein [Betaproteobacteria bacterium]